MKRTAIKRSTKPMKRTRLKAKRGKQRRSGRIHDPAYMARVRELPCCASYLTEPNSACQGDIEADHAGRRPVGRKCSDHETIPLCSKHHRNRTDHPGPSSGVFWYWTTLQMRSWLDACIAATQRQLGYVAKEAA